MQPNSSCPNVGWVQPPIRSNGPSISSCTVKAKDTYRIFKAGRPVKASTGKLANKLSLSSLVRHTTGSGDYTPGFGQEGYGDLRVFYDISIGEEALLVCMIGRRHHSVRAGSR